MLKANEARERVTVVIKGEKEAIILKAKEFCETVVDKEIKKAVADKFCRVIVKCNEEIKEEVCKYLRVHGYVVYYCGCENLEIRW